MRVSRRALLSGAGATMVGGGLSSPARAAPRVHLRLLETSDLHMFARDWDYYRQRSDPTVGLNHLGLLIEEARASAPNTLLFDNGDILQGNPLGDFVAEKSSRSATWVHPMFRAMNRLSYDVATVGNHEFNYGLGFLEQSLRGAAFPFVCANLARADGSVFLPPYHVIERVVIDEDGVKWPLRVGVIGFTPPQIMIWDKSHLEGKLTCGDIVATARRLLPGLRARCDIIVALSHSGISSGPVRENEENASLHLASLGEIDAVFTGHSHRVFPGPDYSGRGDIDAEKGTLSGVPAVMPGFWGSHLGVIDLALARDGERWRIANFTTEARPIYRREGSRNVSLIGRDARIDESVEPEHDDAKKWVSEPIGQFVAPVHSYFVFAGYDPATAVVNEAQIVYARDLLAATRHAGLPILSAAAPFKAGYTPDWFIDIAAGAVARRDVADLYMYPNTIAAVRVSGAALVEWLEFAARVFNRVDAGVIGPQPLVSRGTPSYNFDVIAGLTYAIDLSQPARHDFNGGVVNPAARRIVDLRYEGEPIDLAREFVVVTNNYRADGGGNFPGLGGASIILRAPDLNRDAVLRLVASRMRLEAPTQSPWRFAQLGARATVWFDSGLSARAHVADVPGLRIAGDGVPGYARFEMDLG
jgi:2',3'-cyclic-nucleotide 2'-phosphodiesterase/3'-nucleotidase